MKTKRNKKLLACGLSMALVLGALGGAANGTLASAAKKKATVKLSKTAVTVQKGKKTTLKIKKKNIKKVKSIKWSSKNKKVATVSKKGAVKGVKVGKTTITCKVKYVAKGTKKVKAKTLKCKVTVKKTVKKAVPTAKPVVKPTVKPSVAPSAVPTEEPTTEPTAAPTEEPTTEPTTAPTEEPTTVPTEEPTTEPTTEPTADPTTEPTTEPTADPVAKDKIYSVVYTVKADNSCTVAEGFDEEIAKAVTFGPFSDGTDSKTGLVIDFSKLGQKDSMTKAKISVSISNKNSGLNVFNMSREDVMTGSYAGWSKFEDPYMETYGGYGIEVTMDSTITISLVDESVMPTIDLSQVPAEITLTKGQETRVKAPVTLPVAGRTPIFDGWAYDGSDWSNLVGISCDYDAETGEFVFTTDADCAVTPSANTKIYAGVRFDIDGVTYTLSGKDILITAIN